MKFSILLAMSLSATVGMVSEAHAADTMNVTVNGAVLEATCNLKASDVNRSIALKQVTRAELAASSGGVKPTDFYLTAENCVNTSNVTFTFSGTPSIENPLIFSSSGTATGAGLRLYSSSDNRTIGANGTNHTRVVPVASGKAILNLGAAYWNLGNPSIGTLQSQARVTLTYN